MEPTFDDNFDAIDLDAIDFTESLANSSAFEHYLFDNMAQRRTSYTSDIDGVESEPILLSLDNTRTILPEAVRDIFSTDDYIIEHLSAFQEESPGLSFFYMKFSANGDTHSITTQSDELHATYTKPNSHGDKVSYTLPAETARALLASFVYAREYNSANPLREKPSLMGEPTAGDAISPEHFQVDDSTIDRPRMGNADDIESLLMTLGHLDGLAKTVTSGLLPAGDKILLAELSNSEGPHMSHVSNDLDLSTFFGSGDLAFDRLSLSQQLADIKAFQGENFNDQIGEIAVGDTQQTVTAQRDLKTWSALCSAFAQTMRTELEPYAGYDESD